MGACCSTAKTRPMRDGGDFNGSSSVTKRGGIAPVHANNVASRNLVGVSPQSDSAASAVQRLNETQSSNHNADVNSENTADEAANNVLVALAPERVVVDEKLGENSHGKAPARVTFVPENATAKLTKDALGNVTREIDADSAARQLDTSSEFPGDVSNSELFHSALSPGGTNGVSLQSTLGSAAPVEPFGGHTLSMGSAAPSDAFLSCHSHAPSMQLASLGNGSRDTPRRTETPALSDAAFGSCISANSPANFRDATPLGDLSLLARDRASACGTSQLSMDSADAVQLPPRPLSGKQLPSLPGTARSAKGMPFSRMSTADSKMYYSAASLPSGAFVDMDAVEEEEKKKLDAVLNNMNFTGKEKNKDDGGDEEDNSTLKSITDDDPVLNAKSELEERIGKEKTEKSREASGTPDPHRPTKVMKKSEVASLEGSLSPSRVPHTVVRSHNQKDTVETLRTEDTSSNYGVKESGKNSKNVDESRDQSLTEHVRSEKGSSVLASIRSKVMSPNTKGQSARSTAMSPNTKGQSARSKVMSPNTKGQSARSKVMSPNTKGQSARSKLLSPNGRDESIHSKVTSMRSTELRKNSVSSDSKLPSTHRSKPASPFAAKPSTYSKPSSPYLTTHSNAGPSGSKRVSVLPSGRSAHGAAASPLLSGTPKKASPRYEPASVTHVPQTAYDTDAPTRPDDSPRQDEAEFYYSPSNDWNTSAEAKRSQSTSARSGKNATDDGDRNKSTVTDVAAYMRSLGIYSSQPSEAGDDRRSSHHDPDEPADARRSMSDYIYEKPESQNGEPALNNAREYTDVDSVDLAGNKSRHSRVSAVHSSMCSARSSVKSSQQKKNYGFENNSNADYTGSSFGSPVGKKASELAVEDRDTLFA